MNMLMCMCTVCVPGACEIQKMASDALELEVQVAVSYHLSPLQERQVLLAVVWSLQHQWSFYSYKTKGSCNQDIFQTISGNSREVGCSKDAVDILFC